MTTPVDGNPPPPTDTTPPTTTTNDAVKNFLQNLRQQFVTERDAATAVEVASNDPYVDTLALATVAYDNSMIGIIDRALADLENPAVTPPAGGGSVDVVNPGTFQGVTGNAFLGGLAIVTLIECMQELVKSQQFREKTDSQLWLDTQAALKDLAEATADLIKEKAHEEAMKHIMLAVCAGISGALSIGCSAMSFGASSAAKAQAFGSLGTGLGNLTGPQGAAGHMIEAYYAIKIGDLDALKEIFDNVKQQLQSMADKISEDEKDARDAMDKFIQAFTQWADKMYEMIRSLTAQ